MLPSQCHVQMAVNSRSKRSDQRKKQKRSSSSSIFNLSLSTAKGFVDTENKRQQQKDQAQFLELVILHNNFGVKCYNEKSYTEAQNHFHKMYELVNKSADRLLVHLLSDSETTKKEHTTAAPTTADGESENNNEQHSQKSLSLFTQRQQHQLEYSLLLQKSSRSSARSVMDQTPFDDNTHDETKSKKEVVQSATPTDLLFGAIDNARSSSTPLPTQEQFRRSEYDEGMHVLKGTIAFKNNDWLCTVTTNSSSVKKIQHTILFCILLYNQGQVCRAKDDGEGALSYFRSALKQYDLFCEQLKQQQDLASDCFSNSRSLIPISRTMILCNIGFIYYQQTRMLESLTVFNEAVKYVKEAENCDKIKSWELALLLNFIGVLHFHTTGIDTESSMKFYEASLEIQQKLIHSLDKETALSVLRYSSSSEALTTKNAINGEHSQQSMVIEEQAKAVINVGMGTTLNNIGRVYYMKGDYTSALRIYQKSLGIRRRYLSMTTRQLDIAATIYNTGQTFHQLGHLDRALEYYEEYLTIATQYFGTMHQKDIAIMLRCIAQIHHERKCYDKAQRYYLEALESIQLSKDLGPNHPEIATTLNKLGNMHYEQGDIDTALETYEEGLVVEKKSLEEGHPNIAVTLNNIAQIWKLRGEYKKAIHYYKQSLKIQRKRLVAEAASVDSTSSNNINCHVELTIPISSIATLYYHLGEYDKALELFQEALCIRTDAYGDEHLDVSSTLNSIGMVLFKKGLHNLATEAFNKSFDIRRTILGEYHKDVAVIIHNMATIHLQRGDNDMALLYYKRTLDIERKALGHDHIDVSLTLHHIGQIYQAKGDIDRAAQYLKESLNIEQLRLGATSMSVAKSLNNLGNLYLQTNDTRRAMNYFSQSLRVYRTLGQGDDRLIITGLNLYSLGLIHPNSAPAA